jgi:hypothetical protein
MFSRVNQNIYLFLFKTLLCQSCQYDVVHRCIQKTLISSISYRLLLIDDIEVSMML